MAVAAPAATSVAPATANETHIEYLTKNTQACVLRPFCFFVSWQGVLTLAYRGFPAPLVALKQQITDYYQGLPKESPGSKWPKTSLASLKEGKRLTPDQLQRLNDVCREQSGIFQAPNIMRSQAILVDNLSTIVYETRCLERVISRHVVPLQLPVDLADAPAVEFQRVQGVVAEADDEDYWFHASRDGNREKHYRSPALGVTLVHELSCFKPQQPTLAPQLNPTTTSTSDPTQTTTLTDEQVAAGSTSTGAVANPVTSVSGSGGTAAWSSALPGIISKFRAAVENEMPGMYAWFDEGSLHVTVRAIIV